MAAELEDAKDAEDAQRHERPRHVVVVLDEEANVVGHDGDHVDHRHDAAHELAAGGGGVQPQHVLAAEDHHAGGVQTEEGHLEGVAAADLRVGVALLVRTGDGLHDVRHHADGDEEAGDVVEDEGRRGGVRILEGAPHLLADGPFGGVAESGLRLLQAVVHHPLGILPLPVAVVLVAAVADDVGDDAEEGQLLVVGHETLVAGVVQLPRPVVVQYVAEEVRVAVEEVLPAGLVVEELPLVAAQQRVRVLLHRLLPRLEAAAADVNDELLLLLAGAGRPGGADGRRRGQRIGGDGHPADGRRPGEGQPGGDGGHASIVMISLPPFSK